MVSASTPRETSSRTLPCIVVGIAVAASTISIMRPTSAVASGSVLPISVTTSRAISSLRASSFSRRVSGESRSPMRSDFFRYLSAYTGAMPRRVEPYFLSASRFSSNTSSRRWKGMQIVARSLIFSASMPPANTAAVLAALEVMRNEPERVVRVNQIGERIRSELRGLGYNVGNSQTPIVPVIIGDDELTFMMWKALFSAGVYTNPVIPPAVPPELSLLRTSYMATHTDEQIDRVVEIFAEVGRTVGIIS